MRVLMEFVNNLVSFNKKKHVLIELQLYTPKLIVRIEQNKGMYCQSNQIQRAKTWKNG